MRSADQDRVGMAAVWLWLLRLGCPAVGFALGFLVGPFVRWVTSFLSSVPGPLELAADIPRPWLVPILTVVGVAVGQWLAISAERDSLSVTVGPDSVVTTHRDSRRYISRSQVGAVFTDPKDLVVLGPDGREVFRGAATDLPVNTLAEVFAKHGYPWLGRRDPHEAEYRTWIDGHPDLPQESNALLRTRRRALESGKRAEAEEIHEQLQERGILVRDRDKAQQYRLIRATSDGSAGAEGHTP
jgi:hypothetical protein